MENFDIKSLFKITEDLATDGKISRFCGDEFRKGHGIGHIDFDGSYFNLHATPIYNGEKPPLNVELIGEQKDKEKLLQVASLFKGKLPQEPFAISKHTSELPREKLSQFYNGYQIRWAFEDNRDATADFLVRGAIPYGNNVTAVKLLDKDIKKRISADEYIRKAVNNGLLLPDEQISNEELFNRISALLFRNINPDAFEAYKKESTYGDMWADDKALKEDENRRIYLMKKYIEEWSQKNKPNAVDVEGMSL